MKVIKNKKYAGFSIAAFIIAGTLLYINPPHLLSTSATDYTGSDKAEGEWQWSVNVQESLTLTVDQSAVSQTGDTNKFLRNKINVSVSSNNGKGFTAGMTTKTDSTNLVHTVASSNTIPTLATEPTCTNADCEAFPANFWGYSLDDTSNTGTYHAMVGSNKAPITVLKNTANGSKSTDVYFGAKADASKTSGTYKGTVTFTVTSETEGAELAGPSAEPNVPSGPSADPAPSTSPSYSESPAAAPTYSYTTGARTYRSTPSSVASNPAAQTSSEANTKKRSTSNDFVSPLGVNEETHTTTNVQHGSVLTTALMCVAFVAAGVGIFFFILAKRRDGEEEGDEIQQV